MLLRFYQRFVLRIWKCSQISLKSFFTKEQCEQITLLALYKRAMWVIRLKNSYFSYVFDSFSPFYAHVTLCSFPPSFPWVIRSLCFLQKSHRERFAHIDLSLTKKRAIPSGNWWANSLPWNCPKNQKNVLLQNRKFKNYIHIVWCKNYL